MVINQPASLNTTEAGKGGIVFVPVSGGGEPVFKIDNKPAVGMAGTAHHMLLLFCHITPGLLIVISTQCSADSSLFSQRHRQVNFLTLEEPSLRPQSTALSHSVNALISGSR